MSRCRYRLGQAAFGLAGLIFALTCVLPASASSLALDPVRLSLSTRQSIGMLTVRNDGDEPTVVQLETVQWTQAGGKDVYTPTKEILATPPIFTVPPHGSQLVRVGLRRPADAARELSYRLFLQEVPPPPKADFTGLRVALRFGVPIFVSSVAITEKKAVPPAVALRWHASADSAGNLALTVANPGDAHVHLAELNVTISSASDPVARFPSPEYVLAGQSRELRIKSDRTLAIDSRLHIHAMNGPTPVEADVVLEHP